MVVRTEDAIFFVFDNDRVREESDVLEDGILYFSPSAIQKSDQSGLVGQLIGISRFLQTTFGSPASIFSLQDIKIATRHVEHYTLGLSGKVHCSSGLLCDLLNRLLKLFQFYQGGFSTLEKQCKAAGKDFFEELQKSWDCFTAFIKRYGDITSSDFQSLPYLKTSKVIESEVYIQSAHLLDDVRNMVPGIKAGCLLYNKEVCCTQMTPEMTSRFLIIRPKQQNLPCQQLPTELELQGIRIFKVYLTPDESLSISHVQRTCDVNHASNLNFKDDGRDANIISDSSGFSRSASQCLDSGGPTATDRELVYRRTETLKMPNDVTDDVTGAARVSPRDMGSSFVEKKQSIDGGKEPTADHMVEMEMFIQGSSDSVCVLLMDSGSMSDVNVLKKVWKHVLLCISEIEGLIRSNVNSSVPDAKEMHDTFLYHYLIYNSASGSLSGDLLQPVTSPEHDFCHAAQMMHEEFKDSEDTREIILRTHQSVFTGIQDGYEEFFSWSTGFPPTPGLPSSESDPNTDELIRKLNKIKSS